MLKYKILVNWSPLDYGNCGAGFFRGQWNKYWSGFIAVKIVQCGYLTMN